MFTMAKIRDRSTVNGLNHNSSYLDHHLIHNDYYSENNTVEGKWEGDLAETLGIDESTISANDKNFELLRKNINPSTGERLTPRFREGGIRFYDFQCSAQKSVSIMAVTFKDERLRQAHYKAFEKAFKELEKFAGCRDNSQPGTLLPPKTTGNIAAAVFQHDASRALDPQLHTHCVVLNATYDPVTGKILALQESDMVRAIRYAGKVYQNELAREVKRCGYDIEIKINKKGIIEGFEIKGISSDILKKYSKRRSVIEEQIEKFISAKGRKPTTEEIHIITKESRNKKLHEITTEKVIRQQLNQLSKEEHTLLRNLLYTSKNKEIGIAGNIKSLKDENLLQIINDSIGHLYQRKSVLKGNQILAECLNQGLGNIDLKDLKETIIKHEELVNLKKNLKIHYLLDAITTKTGLALEKWSVEKVNNSKNIFNPINPEFIPFDDPKSIKLEKLGKRDYSDQGQVIKGILGSSDQYMTLRGIAGSGKTTSLSELQKGLDKNNNSFYLSPTTTGRDILKAEGFKNAVTVSKFIRSSDKYKNLKNGILIVDEAGLLSNIDGYKIMQISDKYNMRVVFVGDTKQHKSVNAGDFLRILETHSRIHKVELTKVWRQQGNLKYKLVAKQMANGDVVGGIHKMDTDKDMKWVKEGKGKYINNAIQHYLNFTSDGTSFDDCIFVTPTHKEADKITDKLRVRLKEKNILQAKKSYKKEIFKSHNWTQQQKKSTKNYVKGQKILVTETHNNFTKNEVVTISKVVKDHHNKNRVHLEDGRNLIVSQFGKFEVGETKQIELCPGDRIMTRMPDKDISNGEFFTVKNINYKSEIITHEGKIIPKEYSSFQYGYVSTSHKQQGRKSPYVVIAAETINKDAIYVSTTRGVKECRINVPDKELLYKQAEMLTERTAALDIDNRFIDQNTIRRDSFWNKLDLQEERNIQVVPSNTEMSQKKVFKYIRPNKDALKKTTTDIEL